MKNDTLPIEFKKYFWDVDFANLDKKRDYKFILSRVLDRGNVSDCKWVQKNFDSQEIKEALKNTTEFSLRSATFWGKIYDITPDQMKCFQIPYQQTRKTLWPY